MNLHRAKKADWEKVAPSKHNAFQKIAVATGGFLTPANLITVIGLGIVVYGLIVILQGWYLIGLLLLAGGRLLDVADGLVADITKTKSPLGELFDAVADKAGTILTVFVLIIAGIAPWWVIVALILPQLVISGIVFYKHHKRIRVHPTRQGKISMALVWVGVVGLVIAKEIGGFVALEIVTYSVILLSLALGSYATWQYATGRNQD